MLRVLPSPTGEGLPLQCPTLGDCRLMGCDAPRGGSGSILALAWPGGRSLRWGLEAVWCDGICLDVLNLSRLADTHARLLQIARERLAEIRAAGSMED